MSTPVIFREFTVAMQGIPGNGQVFVKTRVGAGLSNGTITFTQPLVDNAGVVLTGDFILGIRVVKGDDINYVEQVRVPANGMSTDGITASNCIRGLDKDSMVFDVGNEANAVELPQDSIVEFVYSIQERTMVAKFITGVIGSGGDAFDVGTRGGNTVVYKFDNVIMIRRVVTSALLTGDTDAEVVSATWAAVTDGSTRISIDGIAFNIDGIDFTGAGDMDAVAAILQVDIRAASLVAGGSGLETVTFSVDHFIISSGITTPTSAITVTSTSTGTVGTDISGAGAADWLDADTANGVVTNFTSFIEFSDDGSSFTKMSTVGAHGNSALAKDHSDIAAEVSDSDVRGDIIVRDITSWNRLAAGAKDFVFSSNGAGTDPSYKDPKTLVNEVPSGASMLWLTDTAPTDWIFSFGQEVNNTTHEGIFDAWLGEIIFTEGVAVGTFNVDAGTDIITAAAHGLNDDDIIVLTNSGGALPAGLAVDTKYFVITSTTNTFQVSLTEGGSAVDITGTGTGTHSFHNTIIMPDARGRLPLFQDDMGGTPANVVTDAQADILGGKSGDETKDISHTHSIGTSGNNHLNTSVTATRASVTDSGGSVTQDVMNPFLTFNLIVRK